MTAIAIAARARVEDVNRILETSDAVAKRYEVLIQLADADAVYSQRHIDSAIFHAQRAFEQGTNSARALGPEILMYLAGERRIHDALAACGVKPGQERVAIIAVGPKAGAAIWGLLDRLRWSKDPAGFRPNPKALVRHKVDPTAAGAELTVLERVALVDVRK